jgi:hypothetical protein
MRSGVIIEEGSPQDILIKSNTQSLESAFLILCNNQDKNKVFWLKIYMLIILYYLCGISMVFFIMKKIFIF